MKEFTQKFIGLLALIFVICFTINAQEIGDNYEGGYIFQINEDGTGLVADLQDLGLMNWDDAMDTADVSTSQGYDDWYLPSKEELELIYNTIGTSSDDNIGGFDYSWYWSSSEYSSNYAWFVSFGNGGYDSYDKTNAFNVRVIRSVAFGEDENTEEETADNYLDLPEGWSMFGYTCIDSVDAMVGFSEISDKIEIVKDEWGLSYLPSWEFNAMGGLHFSEGYQIKMLEEVTGFQFCEAIVPEDGIGQPDVDAAYAEGAASVNPEDGVSQDDVDSVQALLDAVVLENGITQADLDAANSALANAISETLIVEAVFEDLEFQLETAMSNQEDGIGQDDVDTAFDDGWNEGVASVTPEDGISQADVDAAVAEVEANFAASLSVGDFYQGGIVFQINEDGTGLVSAQVDLGDVGDDESTLKQPFDENPVDLVVVNHAFEWGCYGENVNGADGISIGTGYQNTLDIVNQECVTESGGISAAQESLDAEISGFSDWFLPSIDELKLMYNTIGQGADNSGNFKYENYWSSSKNDYYNLGALSVNFLDGYSDSYYKSNSYRVRVIRAF